MELKNFIEHITYLCMAYNKDFNKEQCITWYDYFKEIKSDNLAKAIKKVIKTSKFYPTIAELLEECTNVKNNYKQVIIQKMVDDGYFHNQDEIDKAINWILRDAIPEWFIQDMKRYGYNEILLKTNDKTRLLEETNGL